MKIGDIVICKTFPKNFNGYIRDYDPNITIDKGYKILTIEEFDHTPSTGLRMLLIIGNIDNCWYWSDYFYTKQEARKLKLKKMYDDNKE